MTGKRRLRHALSTISQEFSRWGYPLSKFTDGELLEALYKTGASFARVAFTAEDAAKAAEALMSTGLKLNKEEESQL